MIPATANPILNVDRTLIVTLVWVVRMGIEWNFVIGMANIERLLNKRPDRNQAARVELALLRDAVADFELNRLSRGGR